MLFSPVVLQDITPILDIAKANPEFQYGTDPSGKIGFITYAVAYVHTFPPIGSDPEAALRRECKSIMYDLQTLKIISRRQHKFFNLGEREETLPENIDWSEDHVVLEKLDGTSMSPILIESEDKIYWTTRRGITQLSDLLDPYVRSLPKYDKFARKMVSMNLSACLEWCTPRNKIILTYPEDSLTITTIRHNVTGEYLSYDEIVEIGKEYDIPVVKKLRGKINNLNEFLEFVREAKNIEGFVIRFKNDMLKVKCKWYLQIHKMLDNIKLEKDVLRYIINNQIDDVKPFLLPEIRDKVEVFNDEVLIGIRDVTDRIINLVNEKKGTPKKDIALEFAKDPDLLRIQKFVMDGLSYVHDQELLKQTVYDAIIKHLNKCCFNGPRLDENRSFIGGARWVWTNSSESYLDSSE